MANGTETIELHRVSASRAQVVTDVLAIEAPLEIRVQWLVDGVVRRSTVSLTMRTPGADEELAAGFLFNEGIVRGRDEITGIRRCAGGAVRVELAPGVGVDLARLERHGLTSSACGMCGKTSATALASPPAWSLLPNEPLVPVEIIQRLPALLRSAQALFDTTGGLHASALFDTAGRLLAVREDVGRHNALDKVIGAELLAGRLPARERILIVSGRVSFELVQKATMAGIPIVAAIGAPSSMAVDLARSAGLTLIGFLRSDRCNVYTDNGRVLIGSTVS